MLSWRTFPARFHPEPPGAGGGAPPGGPREVRDCGDLDIRIARDGTWFHQGTPIGRPALVKLFASVLRRDAAGQFWLVTPAERGRVAVDDAPFLAVELRAEGEGAARRLSFRTNIDEWVTAGPGHAIRVVTAADGAPSPYIHLRDGIEARLGRAVFYELVELGGEEPGQGGRFGVWSEGMFFPLDGAG